MTLDSEHCEELYRYLAGILKRLGCKTYCIGGIENHVHILLNLSPTLSMTNLMWMLKRNSCAWAQKSGLFPAFDGWGDEYGAFSISLEDKRTCINYIDDQRHLHEKVTFEKEFRHIVESNGITWDDSMFK